MICNESTGQVQWEESPNRQLQAPGEVGTLCATLSWGVEGSEQSWEAYKLKGASQQKQQQGSSSKAAKAQAQQEGASGSGAGAAAQKAAQGAAERFSNWAAAMGGAMKDAATPVGNSSSSSSPASSSAAKAEAARGEGESGKDGLHLGKGAANGGSAKATSA